MPSATDPHRAQLLGPHNHRRVEFAMALASARAAATSLGVGCDDRDDDGADLAVGGVPVQVREMLRAVAPLAFYGDGQALARMEWMPVEDTQGVEDDDRFDR